MAKKKIDCEAYDFMIRCDGHLCIAHIITRRVLTLADKNKNQLKICKSHEIFFNRRPSEVWYEFVKNKFPDRFEFVKKHFNWVMDEYKKFLKVTNDPEYLKYINL